jgi:photosystem II stability/assembly factor-like uncharacterized protein
MTALCTVAAGPAGAEDAARSSFRSAPMIGNVNRAPVLAAARAGKRIVAVGDYGIVILSDDARTFRQAKSMPTRTVLTSIFFLDKDRGWAAGHDGTVVATGDGGETWHVLREEPGKERALLSVWFENDLHGFAVGQFGLALETQNGGASWTERRLVEQGDAGDRHLYHIFSAGDGFVLVAAEGGGIFRSEDSGRTWQLVQTENKGSFWTGAHLSDGTVLVAGMRGHVFRSEDRGRTWHEVDSGTQQSLTGIVEHADGSTLLIGMSGVMLARGNKALSFVSTVRPDRTNLTAAVAGDHTDDMIFSLTGVVGKP